jgi:hypothetical protein
MSSLGTVDLRVPSTYIKAFSVLNVCSSSKENVPLTDADVSRDLNIFGTKIVSLNNNVTICERD